MADSFLPNVEGFSDLTQKSDQVLGLKLLLGNKLVFELHLLAHNSKVMGDLGIYQLKFLIDLLQRCILSIVLFEPCVLFVT